MPGGPLLLTQPARKKHAEKAKDMKQTGLGRQMPKEETIGTLDRASGRFPSFPIPLSGYQHDPSSISLPD